MERLRLYDYAPSANCLKVRLLLAHLDRPYERVPVDIFAGETLTDEYAAINPARSTPVLRLEDGSHLAESNAILAYLAEGTPFLSAKRVDRAQTLRWLLAEQTEVMMTMGGLRFRLQTGRIDPDSRGARARHAASLEALGMLDAHLDGRDFFVGDAYSIADIAVYGYAHVAPEAGLSLEPFPAVRRWLARVAEQPGHINDLAPYPPNARSGAGQSIYD